MSVNIQVRRDSAANWAAANPLLSEGEIALELDTFKIKVGDGVTLYNALPYWFSTMTGITELTGDVTAGPGSGTQAATISAAFKVAEVVFIVDGGGGAITTGLKGFIKIPFACTIDQVDLYADQAGSVVVDIYKDVYANFPPTGADTITAAAKPTLVAADKYQDATLTGWITSIAAGDVLAYNIDSASTITRLTVTMKVTRT